MQGCRSGALSLQCILRERAKLSLEVSPLTFWFWEAGFTPEASEPCVLGIIYSSSCPFCAKLVGNSVSLKLHWPIALIFLYNSLSKTEPHAKLQVPWHVAFIKHYCLGKENVSLKPHAFARRLDHRAAIFISGLINWWVGQLNVWLGSGVPG